MGAVEILLCLQELCESGVHSERILKKCSCCAEISAQ